MLPFFTQPILQLGPLTIHAFGIAVAVAMLWGTRAAERIFEHRALDKAIGARLATWVLIGGAAGAHLFAVLFYKPHLLLTDPWLLLRFWEEISSFGGMLGGVAGALLFFHAGSGSSARVRGWEYLGSIAQIFPVSLAIGRLGCALAHDHPGTVTTFPLAFSLRTQPALDYIAGVYAEASRPLPRAVGEAGGAQGFHDLGWYEFLFLALVVVPLFQLWQRRDKPGGFYLIAFPVLYLPVRFGLDFLRVADVRYSGLTPAQWVAILVLSLVAALGIFPAPSDTESALRTVVIGATGHIGTWLVPRLVRDGHTVLAVSRGVRKPYHECAEWGSVEHVTLDRVTAEHEGWFGTAIARLQGEAVVDLTCFDPLSAMHMVRALRDRVEVFVHCGTLWVHGVPSHRPYDEKAPRHPFGDYGIRKAQVERMLIDAADNGFPATVLHPGHISGPGWAPINPAGHLDTRVFDALARGEQVTLADDGLATLQHVHADDVAQAFVLAIARRDDAIGEAFHVAAAEPVTMRAYADAVASWFGRDANLAYLPWEEWQLTVSERDAELTRDHMLHSPCASIAKARKTLGFEPRFSALAAVRDALTAMYPALA